MRISIFFLLCAGLGIGCSAPLGGGGLPIGSDCIVQLNRNQLGFSTQSLSVVPTQPIYQGSFVEGKLMSADPDWIVLDVPNVNPGQNPPAPAAMIWIPRRSVLLLQFNKNQ